MSETTFLRPRLIGARFESHSIPLELLKNLAALEKVIIEVAKLEFLKDHPNRRRVPRGFTDGIELKLTGIEDGSAVLEISLFADKLPLPEKKYYFERARDVIIRAIGDAEESKAIIDILPEKTLRYFDKIRRGLREDEAIEFIRPNSQFSVRLTSMVKERYADITSEQQTQYIPSTVKQLKAGTTVRGTVPEINQGDMTFQIQLFDGQQVKAPIAPQHFDAILEAFNGYKNDLRFLFQGVGRFNLVKKLLEFDSIERISLLDELDISAQIDDLRLLKDGWLEGQGKAPSQDGLDWLSQAFKNYYSGDLPQPYLYPTEPGGVQAEWSLDQNEITLEINLAEYAGYFHALHVEDDTEKTRNLDLGSETHWIELKTLIASMSEST